MGATFSLTITPTADDIDELGHVNNAVWVKWIQDVATAHWNAIADPKDIEKWIWVVVRHEIDYSGNVKLGETVTSKTWVSDPPKGARFDRKVEFLNQQGKVVVKAKTSWALLDKATGRLARVPNELAQTFLS